MCSGCQRKQELFGCLSACCVGSAPLCVVIFEVGLGSRATKYVDFGVRQSPRDGYFFQLRSQVGSNCTMPISHEDRLLKRKIIHVLLHSSPEEIGSQLQQSWVRG